MLLTSTIWSLEIYLNINAYINLHGNLFTSMYTSMYGSFLVAQWLSIQLQFRKHMFNPWVRKIPQRRQWQPTPVFFQGRRSLAGYNALSHKRVGYNSVTKQQQYIYVHIHKLDYLIMGMNFYFYLQGIQYDTVFVFLHILTLGTELKKIISFSNE